MKPMLEETSISKTQIVMPATSGKTKLLAVVEVLLVYALVQALVIALRSTAIMQWEIQNLGWSYTGMLILVGIPAIVMWLGRRNWAEYGVSLVNWQTNLDIGIKAYLVAFIPLVFGVGGAMQLGLDPNQVSGGLFVVMMEVVGLALMGWILNRHKSGFGEEFAYRGYFQSRLNQAFGRPVRLFGIQFGPGLIIASLLFGLLHAFNTYDPAIGLSSLAWGWTLWTFMAGLFFGMIREKTGTLVAPGIAHGLRMRSAKH